MVEAQEAPLATLSEKSGMNGMHGELVHAYTKAQIFGEGHRSLHSHPMKEVMPLQDPPSFYHDH